MKLSNNKEYKKVSKKREEIFSQIEDKLKSDKELLSEYERTELEMYEKQIHKAYRTGVSDSIYMFIEGLKKEYGKLNIEKFIQE